MDNFLATFKDERFHCRKYNSQERAYLSIFEYLEVLCSQYGLILTSQLLTIPAH